MSGVRGQRITRGRRHKNGSERLNARLLGEPMFSTGQACIRGHRGPRYVSTGACVECQRAFARAHRVVYRRRRSGCQAERAFTDIAQTLKESAV